MRLILLVQMCFRHFLAVHSRVWTLGIIQLLLGKWLLWNRQIEYVSLFIGLHKIITTVELILYDTCTILPPQTLRVALLSFLRAHMANHILPLDNGISR